jgi:hypothetical protein
MKQNNTQYKQYKTIHPTLKEKKQPIDTIKIIKKNTIVNNKTKIKPMQNKLKTKSKINSNKQQIKVITYNSQKSTTLNTKNLDDFKFDLIKKGTTDNNTLLVVGGIQGDEPGGFMAASLLSTHYKITNGSVWIVPNLNFYSIIKRDRGLFGDMNRKFAYLPKSDPEYKIIQRIKGYISDSHVKLILNLHDGSGFYRPIYIDRSHQPLAWGQSSVIDQDILPNVSIYGNTYHISEQVVKHINKHLLKAEDIYRTKNTHTRFKKTFEEKEMVKTLTFYAVTHGKAAFGHETSKSLNLVQRVYYKMLAIEKYMDIMGIKYQRLFPLTLKGIKKALNNDISIKFKDTKINIPLKDIRNIQKYFPINKDGIIKYLPSNPLIKIIKKHNIYTVYYGNRRLTQLKADYREHLNFNTKVQFNVDGKIVNAKFGDTIKIKKYFKVLKDKRFRINVIGYKNKQKTETNQLIKKNMIMKRYSIEKHGDLYRIEFYKKNKFVGIVLIKFILK